MYHSTRFILSSLCAGLLATSGAVLATGDAPQTSNMTGTYLSDNLIGMEVRNSLGENLGEISQLSIDQSGQVTHAVLSTGGVLGVAEEDYAVPWNRLELSKGREYAQIDVNMDEIPSEFSAFEIEKEQ